MLLLAPLLERLIKTGSLTVIDRRDRPHVFGDGRSPCATMVLRGRWTAAKIAVNPGLYLGEAWMDGDLAVKGCSLYELIDLLTRNLPWGYGRPRVEGGRLGRWLRMLNPPRRARRNVAHHYDLSDALYDLFLDDARQYSCGYFLKPDDDLGLAQRRKMALIARKLVLKPGQQVLDVGCGWGGLARHLARAHDVAVTGITLSENQFAYARRQRTEHTEFALRDFRHESRQYDRIVSVGMFEHVGVPHYDAFFAMVRRCLRLGGVALLHTIGAAGGGTASNAWIDKYIFPGGHIPGLAEIVPAVERAGLYITDIEVLRLHYAETLKAWRHRFLARRTEAEALYDARFCRMWEYYLCVSETAFRNGDLVVFQIQLARKQDAAPLTRDYLTGVGQKPMGKGRQQEQLNSLEPIKEDGGTEQRPAGPPITWV